MLRLVADVVDHEMPRQRRQRLVLLPSQQQTARTFIARGAGVRAKIAKMNRSSLEDSVSAVMIGILALLRPVDAGYCSGPEEWVQLSGKRGRIDMAYNWSPDGVRLLRPLCLEYKAPGRSVRHPGQEQKPN
jgi:hypothetical protein